MASVVGDPDYSVMGWVGGLGEVKVLCLDGNVLEGSPGVGTTGWEVLGWRFGGPGTLVGEGGEACR